MGGRSSTHHHYPPPPSLAERRANVDAKMESERKNYELFLKEQRDRAAELEARNKEHQARTVEYLKQLTECEKSLTDQTEQRRHAIVAQLMAEAQAIERQMGDTETAIKQTRESIARQESRLQECQGKLALERTRVQESSTILKKQLDEYMDRLKEASELLTKGQADALAQRGITDATQRTFIELQFLLQSLPQNAMQTQDQLNRAAQALSGLLSGTLQPCLQSLEKALGTKIFATTTPEELAGLLRGVNPATLDILKNRAMDPSFLKEVLASAEMLKAFFPALDAGDRVILDRTIVRLERASDTAIKEIQKQLDKYNEGANQFGLFRSKAQEATKKLTMDERQARMLAIESKQ